MNIISKIIGFFKKQKDYSSLYAQNFIEHGYDLKVMVGNNVVWKGNCCNTRVCYDCHLAKHAIAFSDRSQPNIHTNFTMFWCKTVGAARNKLVVGDWTFNLEKYDKEKIVEFLRKYIPADNFYSEHDDETIERAFKV